jgi:tetratricopeptide (TPR) repeat protein
MAKCPGCDRDVEAEDAFCRHCGTPLRAPQPTALADHSATLDDMAADFLGQLKDKPGDADTLYNLALARYYARDWAGAADCLRGFIQVAPDFADAHGKLAICLWQLGNRAAALASIRQAVSLSPEDRRLAELEARMVAAATG